MKSSFSDMTKKEKRVAMAIIAAVMLGCVFGLWYTSPYRLYPEICGVKEPPRWCMD